MIKKGIYKHCEYLESKIRKKQFKIDELRNQLKQRDEVIDDIYQFVNHYRHYLKINDNDYLKDRENYGELDKWQVDDLLEILQKYKGDNNE